MRFYLKISFLLFFISNALLLKAQRYTLSGYIYDNVSKSPLIGAYINVLSQNSGTVTDENGQYSILLDADTLRLSIEYLGYQPIIKKILLNKDIVLNIEMSEDKSSLKEVVVEANSVKENIERTQMSMTSIDTKEAKLIPVFFGEIDLMKTLALKPGVSSGNEGNSGLYVRGGGPDQNLILMDDALVFNASHLLGFFSLLNPEAVKNIELYKGDFPAQFGGRLSSVVDIKMAEGSKEKFGVKGGLGLISSRLSIEGPIIKNKISFIVSARRTYVDLFTPMINKQNEGKKDFDKIPSYFFYDFNTKISADLSKKDKLTFTGYHGRDILKIDNKNFNSSIRWGNTIASLRWHHEFNTKLISNTSLSYSSYNYTILYQAGELLNRLQTKVSEVTLKSDFQYYHSDKHLIRYGALITSNSFDIGRIQKSLDPNEDKGQGNDLRAFQGGIYLSDEIKYSDKLSFNLGLRLTGFVNDSNSYGGFEPRLSSRYKLGQNSSFKLSYSRMFQYLHLVSNSGATLPNDIWYPSNNNIRPQRSDQLAGGISIGLWDNKYLLSNEVYYKWMKRQIDLKDGAAIFEIPDVSSGFAVGKGWSYGNEIYLEKKKGKFTGWIGYTLSWTWRQFDEINRGEKYPARYDRRHNISVVGMYRLSDRIVLSASWVYATGNAVTLPSGRFVFQDIGTAKPTYIPEFMPRNSFRMPDSHRFDIGLVYKMRQKYGESDFTFSIYNVYNRRNPYFIYIDRVEDENGEPSLTEFKAKMVSLFPIIPSVTYNFKF
ncbi:MAG: TonB-dependent receptor [Cytophagales bacterium]|nr:MAG: TonB-dependent receptor [Cytophagales bacterium]